MFTQRAVKGRSVYSKSKAKSRQNVTSLNRYIVKPLPKGAVHYYPFALHGKGLSFLSLFINSKIASKHDISTFQA